MPTRAHARRLGLALALFLLGAGASAAEPARAAVASPHPLASEAGIEVLRRGGNAFDAAVAVSAALGVVEPYGSGLGGGAFFLLHRASDGLEVVVDGRETAPGAAYRDMYLDADGEPIPGASTVGPLAAGIPGLPAALVHVAQRYGRLPLTESLRPAIRYAEQGFPAFAWHVSRLERSGPSMSPAARAVFLPGGEPPALGSPIRQPDLAATLSAIAARGQEGFYAGPVARKLVAGVRSAGGIWTREDLAGYRVVERTPLAGSYRGVTVVSTPPPSAGGVALINMLNMLSGYDFDSLDRVTRTHLLVEVMRRAYRDRLEYLGDPDFVHMPLEVLLHPFYAAGQRMSLRLDRATPSLSLPGIRPATGGRGTETSHLSILDEEGNAVAATQSINTSYGSRFMPPGTGVLLNNEMDDFSVKPGVPNSFQLLGADPNAIEPGKRMLSSMTPTILKADGGWAILGTPGGSRIITIILQAILAWVDGDDAEAMVSRPRLHHQYFPDHISFETDSLSAEERSALAGRGHELSPLRRAIGIGNLQVVTWDRDTGAVDAASDPRGIGEPRFSAP